MPINSVNTNAQAAVALQNMNATSTELSKTATRIATGREVNSAKDDGSTYAIAKMQSSDASAINAVKDSLSRGAGAVDVALSAGDQMLDILTKMKELALTGTENNIDDGSRKAIQNQYDAYRNQLINMLDQAEFDGINLLKSNQTYRFLASADGQQTVDIDGLDAHYSPFTPGPTFMLRGWSLDSVVYSKNSLQSVNETLDAMTPALAKLATQGQALDAQLTYVGKLQDQLEIGVGNLVDADLSKESAKFTALQTKQSLGQQALAIATNSAGWLKNLFAPR